MAEAGAAAAADAEFDNRGRLTMHGLAIRYRDVLDFKPAKSVAQVTEIIRNLDNRATPGDDYFLKLFLSLCHDCTKPKNEKNILSRGAYGSVYPLETEGRVVKEQFNLYEHDETKEKKNDKCRDFFIETLIHTLLSNDRALGKYTPKIYRVWIHVDPEGNAKAFTEMERMEGKTTFALLRGEQIINFELLKYLIQGFASILDTAYEKYKFVHLDFKLGNTGMYKYEGLYTPKIFDFGSGCIEFEGLKIRARAFIQSDITKSNCSRTADFGLFLHDLGIHFGRKLDKMSIQFIYSIIEKKKELELVKGKPSMVSPTNVVMHLAQLRKPKDKDGKNQPVGGRNLYLAAYNYYDGLYDPFPQFIPESLYHAIGNFEAAPPAAAAAPARERSRSRERRPNRNTQRNRERRSRSRSRERRPNRNTRRNPERRSRSRSRERRPAGGGGNNL